MAVQPIPSGYHTVTPYLTVPDAQSELDFVRKAFDAKEVHVMRRQDGTVGHADLLVGDSHVMLGQAHGEWSATTCQLYLYVRDCDAAYKQALAAGGTSIQEPQTMFYGDRHAAVKDCCGNVWWVATRVEDVPDEELERRAKAAGRG